MLYKKRLTKNQFKGFRFLKKMVDIDNSSFKRNVYVVIYSRKNWVVKKKLC